MPRFLFGIGGILSRPGATFESGESGESGEAIVSAVLAMCTSLKLRVVAEGIESAQQLAFLQTRQCAEGQGFYFSRPLPADEFASLLQTGMPLRENTVNAG